MWTKTTPTPLAAVPARQKSAEGFDRQTKKGGARTCTGKVLAPIVVMGHPPKYPEYFPCWRVALMSTSLRSDRLASSPLSTINKNSLLRSLSWTCRPKGHPEPKHRGYGYECHVFSSWLVLPQSRQQEGRPTDAVPAHREVAGECLTQGTPPSCKSNCARPT